MTPEQASWLAHLKFHWDTAYQISYDEDDRMWRACWTGEPHGEPLAAMTPDSLRDLIREDYSKRARQDYRGLSERMST